MKILTTLTKDYLSIYNDIFIKNLPQNTELITQYFNYNLAECTNKFGSHDSLYKLPFVLDTLKNCKEDEIICYCDVDVVILDDKFINRIKDVDIQLQWDSPEGGICLGLFFIKNTEKMRFLINNFLKMDVDWIIKNYNFSFRFFKYLLDEFSINYKRLPMEYYGGQMKYFNISEPNDIYCYHATYEKTIQDKYNKLNDYLINKKSIENKKPTELKFLILLMYYNRPNLVKNALQSIQNLKYDNYEVAIVDDGSEVNIEELSKKYIPEHKLEYYRIDCSIEDKIKYEGRPNPDDCGNSIHGKYLNKAILESNADIVIPLCDDDALVSDYLNKLNDYFIENPNVKYAFSNAFIFNPRTDIPFNIKEKRDSWGFYEEDQEKVAGVLDSSQVVYRAECFKKDGVRYPYPQTKNLDYVIYKQMEYRYGKCSYLGFFGQYKAVFKEQLTHRKNMYEYID